MKSSAGTQYEKYYRSISFERRELFEVIQREYQIETVLYPGSSIHITPSFYFPHVVYVDKSVMAMEFFLIRRRSQP